MMPVNQKLVIRFAHWAAANGGDVDSASRLEQAARNRSPIIAARMTALLKNSRPEFSDIGRLHKRMSAEFTAEEIQQLLSLPDEPVWVE